VIAAIRPSVAAVARRRPLHVLSAIAGKPLKIDQSALESDARRREVNLRIVRDRIAV
jgi:hypothetical protein